VFHFAHRQRRTQAGLFWKKVCNRKALDRGLPPSEPWASIPDDPHAAELTEKALKDPGSLVQVAAATSLAQMHASGADATLKEAVNDRNLSVVMAAAHALHLLNDPGVLRDLLRRSTPVRGRMIRA